MEDNLEWSYDIVCIPDEDTGHLLPWLGARQFYLKPKGDEWLRVQVEYKGHFIGLLCMKSKDGRFGWLSPESSELQDPLPLWQAIQRSPGWAIVEQIEMTNDSDQP